MEPANVFEVHVARAALDALIDTVHDVALRGMPRFRRVEPHDNVIAVSIPRISDLRPENVPDTYRRFVAAITVTTASQRVDIVFGLDDSSATATFAGSVPLAELLATATTARLSAAGRSPRLVQPVSQSGITAQ